MDKEYVIDTQHITPTWKTIQPRGKKEMCDNVDGSQRRYAKGNKSDTERQILHDITYMRKLKKTNLYSRIVVTRD